VPGSIAAAHERAAAVFATLEELLDLIAAGGDEKVRLVPDTNALLANPDLSSYVILIPGPKHEIVLLPTLLRELDELKDRGRTPELRGKAQAVVRRIKGLRDKGRLTAGVALTKAVTVRAEHRDVEPSTVLGWLSRDGADDALLAGALTLQSDHPPSAVVLITRDLNLQNKCEMVGLPYLEPPPDPALGRARLAVDIVGGAPFGPRRSGAAH
jgi:predicted ribonuclease YlaK